LSTARGIFSLRGVFPHQGQIRKHEFPFGTHYNDIRLHSALGYVTPKDRLAGRDEDIFAQRDRKLAEARERRKTLRQVEHERRQRVRDGPSGVTVRPAIDFAAVRANVTITAVLDLLSFQPRPTHGAQLRGPCPLHGSTAGTSRCFSVHTSDQNFHCFQCGRSGNALDLWAHATRRSPYDSALDLCQRLNIPVPMLSSRNREEEPVRVATHTMEST
jgi:hypothetical protein